MHVCTPTPPSSHTFPTRSIYLPGKDKRPDSRGADASGGTSRPLPGTPAPPSPTSPRPAVDTQPLTLPSAPAPPVPQFHLLRHAPVLAQNPPSVLTHRLSLVTQSVQSSTVSDLKSPHVPSLQNAPRIRAPSPSHCLTWSVPMISHWDWCSPLPLVPMLPPSSLQWPPEGSQVLPSSAHSPSGLPPPSG